jgi:5-methylcytosine-specific restriction protein A
MPWALKRPCTTPGCPNLTHGGKCEKHRGAFNRERRRDPSRTDTFYSSRRWRRLRAWYLRDHPLCIDCGLTASEVDHVRPIRQGGDPWSVGNMAARCKRCHSSRTARQTGWAGGHGPGG